MLRNQYLRVVDEKKLSEYENCKENFIYDNELSDNYYVIDLYDYGLTKEENLAKGQLYLLMKVEADEGIYIQDGLKQIPSPQSKVCVKISDVEEAGIHLETVPTDYDSMFGVRVTSFIQYSSFFSCDERVMFETMIVKNKAFSFRPFHWSKSVIERELGIKRHRAGKIIQRFKELGILDTEILKSSLDGKPRQVTYYTIKAKRIIELIPDIYRDSKDFVVMEREIQEYLKAAV